MITFEFISEEELKAAAKEDNDGLCVVTDEELAEFCADGNGVYAKLGYVGEMYDFMREAAFLAPGISAPENFSADNGYTLTNLAAIHSVLSEIFHLQSEDALLFYNENKKRAALVVRGIRKNI